MHDSSLAALVERIDFKYGGYLDLWLRNEEIAGAALPGQFVMVKGRDGLSPILGRPFDIADSIPEEGLFRIVVKPLGAGTELMKRLTPGAKVQVLGPLGKGIDFSGYRSIGFLARGVGAAAVTLPAKAALNAGLRVAVFLSANTSKRLVCRDDFEAMGAELYTATDDGSDGYMGTATDLLETYHKEHNLDAVFTCGSKRFARYVDSLDTSGRLRGFVFLEGYMACGVGNCHGCAVKKRDSEGYALVCKDGPVFPVSEVVLE